MPSWQLFAANDKDKRKFKVPLHDLLFNLPVDDTTRHRRSLFSSTLVLPGLNIYESLDIVDPKTAEWRDYVFRARGRDLKGAIFDLASLPKVDFGGAQLQGASFEFAQLRSASFAAAQLQGASFFFAGLRDALFNDAQLQGANLWDAHFQGASLNEAQLQGAVLVQAELQGASLSNAELQGANLGVADLEGASLDNARLEGASLVFAQLQGASLNFARLEATDLSRALLWRTTGGAAKLVAVRVFDAPDQWSPSSRDVKFRVRLWNDNAYQDLRKTIEALPPGTRRSEALDRIGRLDCNNADPSLASCDPSVSPPPEVAGWRKALVDANVDDAAYNKALAANLRALVCTGHDDAVYVLRGVAYPLVGRLTATGSGASGLVDFIMSKDCPVSALLTDADKAALLRIKQNPTKKLGG